MGNTKKRQDFYFDHLTQTTDLLEKVFENIYNTIEETNIEEHRGKFNNLEQEFNDIRTNYFTAVAKIENKEKKDKIEKIVEHMEDKFYENAVITPFTSCVEFNEETGEIEVYFEYCDKHQVPRETEYKKSADELIEEYDKYGYIDIWKD